MRIPVIITSLILFLLIASYTERPSEKDTTVIASGQMPSITSDKLDNLHLVWGNGDSILYVSSKNQGESFSKPSLVALLPKLAASSSRATNSEYRRRNHCNGL